MLLFPFGWFGRGKSPLPIGDQTTFRYTMPVGDGGVAGPFEAGGDRMALVSMRGVSLAFGGPKLLDGVDWQVERGERVGLVGRNGAG